MLNAIFDIDRSPVSGKVSEATIDTAKSMELIYSEGNCDYFLESVSERIGRLYENPELPASALFKDMPPCKFKLRKVNILGEYWPKDFQIKYYPQEPELLKITKIHEWFHSIHHLTPDAKNNVWVNFAKTDTFYLELLAQLFTYIYIRDFQPSLEITFLKLTETQPVNYKTFRIFKHYDQSQAEELYWIIRKKDSSNPIFIVLATIAGMIKLKSPKAMKVLPGSAMKRIVPSTEIRYFYRSLTKLSFQTATQISMLKDLHRGKNHEKLVDLYIRSFDHVDRVYENSSEPMTSGSKRKHLPIVSVPFNKTTDVVSFLYRLKKIPIATASRYDFEYVNREISPLRTTHAVCDTQIPASRSGTGGIDFIGWNLQSNLPVLGEIKVKGDQNPFYALIQLLTYLSELSSPNQIDRINRHQLFGLGRKLPKDVKFHLVILSCRLDKSSGKYASILPETKHLATKITGLIDQVQEIVFLYMDPNTKIISVE